MRRKMFQLGFIVCVCLLAVAACNKSDDSNTGGSSSGTGGGGTTTPNTVTISSSAFGPSSLSVQVGTVVTWKNNDAIPHTATSNNGTTFNTGNIAPGGSATYTATTAGTFPYHCEVHPGMTATLIVTP
jgi:plastocyanin